MNFRMSSAEANRAEQLPCDHVADLRAQTFDFGFVSIFSSPFS
jgi:hypothetical protein